LIGPEKIIQKVPINAEEFGDELIKRELSEIDKNGIMFKKKTSGFKYS